MNGAGKFSLPKAGKSFLISKFDMGGEENEL